MRLSEQNCTESGVAVVGTGNREIKNEMCWTGRISCKVKGEREGAV